MAGLDTPGPAEYGNTSETLFSLGSTIGGIGGVPGADLRGGGRGDIDPESDEAGVR